MCLTLVDRFNSKKAAKYATLNPLIAKKDIVVYKSLKKRTDDSWFRGCGRKKYKYVTPYQLFEFEKGYHYYQEQDGKEFTFFIRNSSRPYKVEIFQGLHSCISKDKAKHVGMGENKIIVKMIIPKGAKYFIGDNRDIVSNHLIWY